MARRACKISAFRADFMSAAEDPDQFLQNCIDGELFIYNNTKKFPIKSCGIGNFLIEYMEKSSLIILGVLERSKIHGS